MLTTKTRFVLVSFACYNLEIIMAPSSSGPGHLVLSQKTGVRLPVGLGFRPLPCARRASRPVTEAGCYHEE